MERKAKLIGPDGQMVEVSLNELANGPIVHSTLNPALLGRIRNIYDAIKEVYNHSSLEQFELGFMRDNNPEKEVSVWERIVEAYYESQMVFGTHYETKVAIFQALMAIAANALKPDEENRKDILVIKDIFSKVLKDE